MKYLENYKTGYRLEIFSKDYVSNEFNYVDNSKHKDIYKDLEKIKNLKINHEIYHYEDKIAFGLLFKILIKEYLDDHDVEYLKQLNFKQQDLNYKFTFNWELINEEDIDIIINSNKYNL